MVGILASHGGYTSPPTVGILASHGGYTSLPTSMVGIPASLLAWWVYTLLHPPGYTLDVHPAQHRCTARNGECSLTALSRGVTERTVSDVPLTVTYPFHCWSLLIGVVNSAQNPAYSPYGWCPSAQSGASPSVHPIINFNVRKVTVLHSLYLSLGYTLWSRSSRQPPVSLSDSEKYPLFPFSIKPGLGLKDRGFGLFPTDYCSSRINTVIHRLCRTKALSALNLSLLMGFSAHHRVIKVVF